MSTINSTYYSNVFSGFKEIPERDFSRQIYYVEKHADTIDNMDDYSRVIIMDNYTRALFEIGHYHKCLEKIEQYIGEALEIRCIDNQYDCFTSVLMRKACALYNIDQFRASEHVLKELIKLEPENVQAVKILRSLYFQEIKKKFAGLRALSIMLLFFGAVLLCLELLVIKNFYVEREFGFMLLRNFSIIFAGLGIIGMEIFSLYASQYRAKKYQQDAQAKKSI